MQKVLQKAAIRESTAATTVRFTSLSQREGEVFQLLGCGYGPSQTAEELQVSVKTVEGYLARIKKKLSIGDARTLRAVRHPARPVRRKATANQRVPLTCVIDQREPAVGQTRVGIGSRRLSRPSG